MIGIYCIENKVNDKRYIGQSEDVERRFKRHKNDLNKNIHINKHLQNAWNKYGASSFKFYVIQECELVDLNILEIELIREFNTYHSGYNATTGGESGLTSFLGKKHTEESKQKMRLAKIGTSLSEEHKEKIRRNSKGFVGRKHSEESKRKMSEKAKGRKPSFEAIEKMRQTATGRVFSDETKQKISEKRKGYVMSKETKKKISDTKRMKFSEEDSLKIKRMISEGISYRKIAKEFNCSHMTITRYFKE